MSNIKLTLTDDTATVTLRLPEVPLEFLDSNKDVVNTTLGNSTKVFIYPGADRRVIKHSWAFMPYNDYLTVRGFWERQRSLGVFPRLTIAELNSPISNMPVFMEMGSKQVVDNCETVEDVAVTFTEA